MSPFLGPSSFPSLKTCCGLELISALIDIFASPDGETTSHLTVAPMEVLPRSLRSPHLIVHHHSLHNSLHNLAGHTPLSEAWFQPRAAALAFLEDLASIFPVALPGLGEVE